MGALCKRQLLQHTVEKVKLVVRIKTLERVMMKAMMQLGF